MELIVFTHPTFFKSNSMERFAAMIIADMRARGHVVEAWTATPYFCRLPAPRAVKKWLGYLDQFVVFPLQIRRRARRKSPETLFVFTDETLGPWFPQLRARRHVIHNHGFFALRASRGEFPGCTISRSGRWYQRLIHWGFSQATHFISISDTCKTDLRRYLPREPTTSEVVYNGLNYAYAPLPRVAARETLRKAGVAPPPAGFLLHVGGNQYYKNRLGCLQIYAAYCAATESPLPLWMVGAVPTSDMRRMAQSVKNGGQVSFVSGLGNEALHAAYAVARALIFPSIWEGFGWPIVEALACGCPVMTIDAAPMNLISTGAAQLIPPMPLAGSRDAWASQASGLLLDLLHESDDQTAQRREAGLRCARIYSAQGALEQYERIYLKLIAA